MNTIRRVFGGIRTRSPGELVVELTLLVTGILLALAVDGWIERRREAAVAAQSLELVRNDLVQLREQASEIEAYSREVLEAVAVVWPAVDGPGLVDRDPAIFNALSTMVSRRTVHFPRAAYEELVATGHLRALSDSDLRGTLVRFYEELARDEEIILRNNETFTDVLINRLLIGEGLIIDVPTGQEDFPSDLLGAREALRSESLPVGVTFKGRLWQLPSGHPDRIRLLSTMGSLAGAAAAHAIIARNAAESASGLIDRIEASQRSGGE